MKNNLLYRAGAFALSIGIVLSSAACTQSKEQPSSTSSSTEQTTAEPSARPAFWDHCTLVAGTDNLYELKLDGPSDRNYVDISAFGDGVLLTSTYFNMPEAPSGSADGEDYVDDTPFYQFDYYDLSKNAITASLDTGDLGGTSYQIINDRLFLFTYESQKLLVYNEQLKQDKSYDLSGICDEYGTTLYPDRQPDRFFMYNYALSSISLLDLSGEEIQVEPVELDDYVSTIDNAALDGSGLIFSGIKKESLLSEAVLLDTSDYSTTTLYVGNSLYTAHLCPSSYLLQRDFSRQVWLYGDKDGRNTYYALPESHFLYLCPDGRLLETYSIFPDSEAASAPTFTFSLYGADGKGISTFSFDCSTVSPDCFINEYPAYLEKYGCMMFLTYNDASANSLLVWDIGNPKKAPEDLAAYTEYAQACDAYDALCKESGSDNPDGDTEAEEDQSTIVTLIPDPQDYDWGELADCRNRADQLEEKYGISIYIGPEVPGLMQGYHVGQCLEPQTISAALEDLDNNLACYPDGFFSQLRYDDISVIRFYLAGTLTAATEGVISDPAGFVCDPIGALGVVLSTDYLYSFSYTLNHEIAHMIDHRLTFRALYVESSLFSEEKWNSYNPEGYYYMESYDGYEDNDAYYQHPEYFYDSYGTTYPTEDRAQLFGASVANHLDPDDPYSYENITFTDSPERLAKLTYYCECIRDGFNTDGWPDVLPWEEIPAKAR